MLACTCRRISKDSVVEFLNENPHMLGKSWKIVSTKISGKPPQCDGGKGICTEDATALMSLCSKNAPCPH